MTFSTVPQKIHIISTNTETSVLSMHCAGTQDATYATWSHLDHTCTYVMNRVTQLVAAGLRENGERNGKWKGNGERMRKWREIYSLHFLIFSLFPPSLTIYYIKNCLILSQKVANVTKNLKYAL